jgi:hypothetical protein
MARIVVMNDQQDQILLDEQVQPIHFEDKHASLQILERLAWAIREAHLRHEPRIVGAIERRPAGHDCEPMSRVAPFR